MNQVTIIRRMAELAKAGGNLSADEALVTLAEVINRLDMNSDTYEADIDALLGVGAAVWILSEPTDKPTGHIPE